MFTERDAMVKWEQYRDLQREAERARLIQPARAGRTAAQVALGLARWIGRLAGSVHLDPSGQQPIYRSENW